jgi:hypothetical protein
MIATVAGVSDMLTDRGRDRNFRGGSVRSWTLPRTSYYDVPRNPSLLGGGAAPP